MAEGKQGAVSPRARTHGEQAPGSDKVVRQGRSAAAETHVREAAEVPDDRPDASGGRTVRVPEPRVQVERFSTVERALLRELSAAVAAAARDETMTIRIGAREMTIPQPMLEGVTAVLADVLDALDHSPSVTVVAGDGLTELTSQQAADLLNVSRPYVVKLAREGVLPHRRVGNRHRFALADVLDYRDGMRAVADAALAALVPPEGYLPEDF